MPVLFHDPDFRTSEGELAAQPFFLGRLATSCPSLALAKKPELPDDPNAKLEQR